MSPAHMTNRAIGAFTPARSPRSKGASTPLNCREGMPNTSAGLPVQGPSQEPPEKPSRRRSTMPWPEPGCQGTRSNLPAQDRLWVADPERVCTDAERIGRLARHIASEPRSAYRVPTRPQYRSGRGSGPMASRTSSIRSSPTAASWPAIGRRWRSGRSRPRPLRRRLIRCPPDHLGSSRRDGLPLLEGVRTRDSPRHRTDQPETI